MARKRTFFMVTSGAVLSIAAMAWSAVEPGQGPATIAADKASEAFRDLTNWYRKGPADGTPDWDQAAYAIQGANTTRGPALMRAYGCGSCHVISGVAGARGTVGPPLNGLRDRAYVAGVLPNEPGQLVRWLMNPTVHAPDTAMPDLGVSERDATDMAAYLYTLGGS